MLNRRDLLRNLAAPAGSRVGDKTGTGSRSTSNDVAILWLPGKPPVVIAAYLTGASLDDAGRERASPRPAGSHCHTWVESGLRLARPALHRDRVWRAA